MQTHIDSRQRIPDLLACRQGSEKPNVLWKLLCALSFLLLVLSNSANAQIITTVVGTGVAGFSGDGGQATAAQLKSPDGAIFDNSSNMYICDYANHRVRKVTASGIISTIAGTGNSGYSGDGGPATDAELHGPNSIAIDNFGNLFISTNDFLIRKVNPSGIISTFAGNGIPGYNGDGIPATAARLGYCYVGVTDAEGNLYFSDYGNYRVRKVSTSGIISTVVGNGVPGYSGDGGPATSASIRGPAWVSFSPTGELYVPCNTGRCIRKIDGSGIITTFAGTGIVGNSGDGGPATAAQFIYVNSVAFDNAGNTYISDTHAGTIRKVNSVGTISTIAGIDTPGYSGDEGPATDAQLDFPMHITTNTAGNLFIADYNNNRIRKITFHPDGVHNINVTSVNATSYPNPAQDKVTITTNVTIKNIEIRNLLGQKVAAIHPSTNKKEVTIQIQHLLAGIYVVEVNGVYVGRFMKE